MRILLELPRRSQPKNTLRFLPSILPDATLRGRVPMKPHSPPSPESPRSRPAVASARAIDLAVPETETSTALYTRSRLPDCAATTNPGPTKPNAPPRARRIETSAAASNARRSTALPPHPGRHPPSRRVQRPRPRRLTNIGTSNGLLREFFAKGTDLSQCSSEQIQARRALPQQPAPQTPRVPHPKRSDG